MKRKRDALNDWLDALQARGRYTFTRADALREGPVVERTSYWRAARKKRLIQPRTGFYVIVAAEYRAVDAPPPSWFIDDLMRFEQLPYYVGLLSAAAIQGASPQAAQAFQVFIPVQRRPIRTGRLRIHFITRSDHDEAATLQQQTQTGRMQVSTPEQTVLDLVAHPHVSGGWDNVASIVAELAPQLHANKLARLASTQGHTAVVQRLGYLLDLAKAEAPARALMTWLAPRARRFVAFEPRGPRDAPHNDRWHLIINRRFELE